MTQKGLFFCLRAIKREGYLPIMSSYFVGVARAYYSVRIHLHQILRCAQRKLKVSTIRRSLYLAGG